MKTAPFRFIPEPKRPPPRRRQEDRPLARGATIVAFAVFGMVLGLLGLTLAQALGSLL